MENLQLSNNVEKGLTTLNENKQNSFLKTTLGKVIDKGIDLGIRALLPNIIEDQVISVKNSIMSGGLKSGIKQSIESAIDLGKSAFGIVTGKFENVGQVRNVIKNGGILDGVSSALDFALNKTIKGGIIPKGIGKIIKSGKNSIINAVDSNIESEFNEQINSMEKIQKYENNWNEYYKKQDFDGMEREYKKIKEKIDDVIPIEKTVNDARKIENIHLLIKNKGKNFNLTQEEIELANKLTA